MNTEFLSIGGIEGKSRTFDRLPRCEPSRVAEKTLARRVMVILLIEALLVVGAIPVFGKLCAVGQHDQPFFTRCVFQAVMACVDGGHRGALGVCGG